MPKPTELPKENNNHIFDCDPVTLFREFAAECMELTQTNFSPEKRALYLRMARVLAQRWEKKG